MHSFPISPPVSPVCFCLPQVDAGMKLSLWLAGGLHVTTCALIFVFVLEAEFFQDHSLAVLNAFLAYPIVAYGAFSAYKVSGREDSSFMSPPIIAQDPKISQT